MIVESGTMILEMMQWRVPPIMMVTCLLLSFNPAMEQAEDCH